jgi:hypothetical protein
MFPIRRVPRGPTLREIINQHAYDDAWVPDMLGGRTMAEAGLDRFRGDLLGTRPSHNFTRLVARACSAARNLDNLEARVHCSFGDCSARSYLRQVTMFRALRAHDIASHLGLVCVLPEDLARGLWIVIEPVAEKWRKIGVLPPRVPVPEDASLLDRLLGLTGRAPLGG